MNSTEGFPNKSCLMPLGSFIPNTANKKGLMQVFLSTYKCLKSLYYHAQFLKAESLNVDGGRPYTTLEMLSSSKLDYHQSLFKVTMKTNVDATLGPPFAVNLVIKL